MGNRITIDYSNFSEYVERLEQLQADVQSIFDDALKEAADEVQEEAKQAVSRSNLPAKGLYSLGNTEKSIVDPEVSWNGSIGEVSLGFDKSKPGAGGFLLAGTPKMQPDRKLNQLFMGMKFEKTMSKKVKEKLDEEIEKRLK